MSSRACEAISVFGDAPEIDNPIVGADLHVRPGQPRRVAPTGDQYNNCNYNFFMNATNRPLSNRKNPRLPGYDYAQAGAYFITVVTQGRVPLFGEVANGEMHLNPAGEMVVWVCEEMPNYIPGMEWGIYQVMPNHFHGVIELHIGDAPKSNNPIVGADFHVRPGQPRRVAPTGGRQINTSADDKSIRRLTLGNIVGRFKSLTTRRYLDGVHADNWQPLPTHLWQRNYYEHIIRDDQDYQSIFDYILANPQNWEQDREHPSR